MNWDMIGALAELAGAIAVVVTLAYLATQIRQNNISARVAANQEMTRQYADFNDLLLLNPELEDLYWKGNSGEDLTELEQRKFARLMGKQCWYFAAMHFRYTQQNLSDNEWVQSREMITRQVRLPGFKRWWPTRKDSYSKSYVDFVERLMDGEDV